MALTEREIKQIRQMVNGMNDEELLVLCEEIPSKVLTREIYFRMHYLEEEITNIQSILAGDSNG